MANINIGGRLHSTATGNTVAGADEILDDVKGKKQSVINAETDEALAGKQATIEDLSTIRSGAAAGATAYQKPGTGIPASDTAAAVQTSLGKADTAYQKPAGGIPKSDLSSGVQSSLDLADTAVQAENYGPILPPPETDEFATKTQVSQLEAEVDGYNFGNYVWLNGKGINPTTGAIQNNSDTIASEFYFPVPQGKSYVRFSDNDTTDGNVLQYNIGFYDSNKDILSRSIYETKTKWDLPVNTAYIRVVLALYNQSGSSIGGDQDDYNLGKIELFFEDSVPDRIVSVLEKTEEEIGKSEERVFGDTSFSKAGYINPSTGVLTSGGAWMSTDFIPIAAGDSAEIVNFGTGTVVAAFYNKDKTFISSIAGGPKDKRTVTAPTNACYLRSSNNPGNCEYPYVKVLAIVYEQVVNALNKEAPSVVLKDDVTLLGANAVKGSAIYRIIGYDFPNEGFINQYGTDSASSAWARTNYIPVVEGDKVSVKIYGVRDLICGICFYDKDKQPLTKYVPSADGWYQNSVVIPSGVFYVRSCCTAVYTTSDQGVYLFIIGANEKEIINRHSEELEKTGYDNFVDYPFSFNGKNAAFFGDSITVGYASNPLEIITECYRKILCDKTGLTGLNYAVAGSCVCDEDDAEYMSIRQKITTIVTNESNFDFVFVMGGTNDYWTGKPLGTPADNTNDTFYGSLKTICSHLKANLPSTTPVIFLTPINCSRQDVSAAVASVEDYRKAIFTIATQNGYNVIDTAFIGFPVKYESSDLRTAIIADGVHPTILGHKMLASSIYRKLA